MLLFTIIILLPVFLLTAILSVAFPVICYFCSKKEVEAIPPVPYEKRVQGHWLPDEVPFRITNRSSIEEPVNNASNLETKPAENAPEEDMPVIEQVEELTPLQRFILENDKFLVKEIEEKKSAHSFNIMNSMIKDVDKNDIISFLLGMERVVAAQDTTDGINIAVCAKGDIQ